MTRRTRAVALVVTAVLAAAPMHAFATATASDVMRSAVDDAQAFWATQLPKVYGQRYDPIPPSRLLGYSESDPPRACGGVGTTPYEDVAGNAFYCSVDDFLAWDAQEFIPRIRRQFGDFAVALVAAHELGHAIQERTRTSARSTMPLELQADCFAGAWARHATTTTNDELNVDERELEEALSGYLSFRDPTGTDPRAPEAHGSAFDRISAFSEGFSGGVERCKDYDIRPPTVTEVPFTSAGDFAREGDLPLADLVKVARRDLNAYWKSLLGATPVGSFLADAARARRCVKGGTRTVAACPDGTVAYDPDALRAAYRKHGDNAVATLMAEAWADVARLQGELRASRAPKGRAAECLAGAWAGDLVHGSRTTDATLSPGDLDEAVSVLLAFPGRATASNDGFVRFRAFRTGFVRGAEACGLETDG